MHAPLQVPSALIRCRSIVPGDVPAVISLLDKGFKAERSRVFWNRMFDELGRLSSPGETPKYGYVLEHGEKLVGVLLLICGPSPSEEHNRCNVSSWYVEPEFRAFAALLSSRALRDKAMTYLNVSPAPHTWRILEMQGFRRYVDGMFVSLPFLSAPPREDVAVVRADALEDGMLDPFERDLLATHARLGCVSVCCKSSRGVHPFVFRRRMLRRVVPCFQLVFCRELGEFVHFARPLGRYVSRHGRPLVLVDANGPVPGLVGRYCEASGVKYYKGPHAPRLGDLSYTETSLFGV
jgi:hypothetical protein